MQSESYPVRAAEGMTYSRAAVGMTYSSGKNYTHAVGLSCAFRQWRADSHCRYLHGYALQVDLEFGSTMLDERNWVQDFGGLKEVKKFLEDAFDHKTIVAKDDPQISMFREMQTAGMCQITILDAVGCEAFARFIHDAVWHIQGPNSLLKRVTVREHASNWASYGDRS